ncbi:cytochrome P450 [Multifurca ochricompacta]|uniref:Cytochrome P450 n=1 Tax=Multifurca ochricompacta TaxID=376703 RepID=A0AAD4QRR3_9AGAM|nr:cytochrome P450 [Multifurca ochricompacta]
MSPPVIIRGLDIESSPQGGYTFIRASKGSYSVVAVNNAQLSEFPLFCSSAQASFPINMAVTSASLLFLSTLISSLLLWVFALSRRGKSILHDLRGPESKSFWLGNQPEYMFQKGTGESEFKWMGAYGSAWRVRGCMGEDRLMVADPKALQYILHASGHDFPKTPDVSHTIRMLIGDGIGCTEGEIHRRQRKVMAAAFSVPHLKAFLIQFQFTASKLAQKWKDEIATDPNQEPLLNVSEWLSRTTLDIIGEAGFDFDFGALDNSHNPVTRMYDSLFVDSLYHGPLDALFESFWRYLPKPILNLLVYLPRREYRRFRNYLGSIREVARGIVRKSIVKGDGRDIMSVLLRANDSEDPRTKLSDNEVVDQISTLLLAGHDTSANSLTWFFWELAKHPESARAIHEEIAAVRARIGSRDFSISDLEGMSTMVAALKESMRLHPIVWQLSRVAANNDVIPLAFPIITKSGKQISAIPICKGTHIDMSFCSYSRLPEVWGEDADKWNPERFHQLDKEKQISLGLYANLINFSGGIRGCLGWRFAIIEMQAIAAALLENFEFSLPPQTPETQITRKPLRLMVPMVEGSFYPWMGLKVRYLE